MGVDTARVVHNELLEESLRDLVCVFCQDLIDPHHSVQAGCGHAFCTSCINHALDSGFQSCPLDKKPVIREELKNLKDVNPLVYRLLGRTEVRCVNFKDGCGWRGDLFDAPAHLEHCLTQERHCQCCQMRRDEPKAAKELLVGYERLVKDYKNDIRTLKENALKLEAELETLRSGIPGRAPSWSGPRVGSEPPSCAAFADQWQSSIPGRADSDFISPPTVALPSAPPLGFTCAWSAHPSPGSATRDAVENAVRQRAFHSDPFPPHDSAAAAPPPGHGPLAVVTATAELHRASLGHTPGWDQVPLRVRTSRSGGDLGSSEEAVSRDEKQAAARIPGQPSGAASPGKTSPRYHLSRASPPRIPRQPWQGAILSMTLHGHSVQISAMAVSPDGRTLFSGALDGSLRVWRAGRCIFSQGNFHSGSVLSLAYAADTDTIYSAGEDRAVKMWRGVTRCIVAGTDQQAAFVDEGATMGPVPLRVCYAGSGRLVIAYSDGRVISRDASLHAFTIREKGPCSTTMDLTASGSSHVFFSGSPDHSIWVHSWGVGSTQLFGHDAEVGCLAAGPNNTLVSFSKDGVVKEWQDGAVVASWTGWRAQGRLAVGIDGTLYCGKEKESVVQCRRFGRCVYTLRELNICKDETVAVVIGTEGILYSGERGGAIRMWRCPD